MNISSVTNYSTLSQISVWCSNLANQLVEQTSENPLLSLATAVGAVAIGGLFAYRRYQDKKPSIQRLVQSCEIFKGRNDQIRIRVDQFVEELWKSKKMEGVFANPENRTYLKKKLLKVIDEVDGPAAVKIQICQNVVRNYFQTLSEVAQRVRSDLRGNNAFRYAFSLSPRDVLDEVTVFDGETHNGGKNVYFIRLANGRAIVYKPRSTKTEEMICGKEGLFASLRLPNYTAYTATDINGEAYGYCHYLKYKEKDNSFKGERELREYLQEIALIEQVAREIYLTDLHYLNLIVMRQNQRVRPFVIDPEVILSPPSSGIFQTGLVSGVTSGSFEFPERSKNRIQLGPELLKKIPKAYRNELDIRIHDKVLLALGINFEKMLKESAESWGKMRDDKMISQKIQSLRASFSGDHLRIIPVSTSTLSYYVRLPLNTANEALVAELGENLGNMGFHLTNELAIREGLEQDILNDDIPIFYSQPSRRLIFYHGRVIARRDTANGVDEKEKIFSV